MADRKHWTSVRSGGHAGSASSVVEVDKKQEGLAAQASHALHAAKAIADNKHRTRGHFCITCSWDQASRAHAEPETHTSCTVAIWAQCTSWADAIPQTFFMNGWRWFARAASSNCTCDMGARTMLDPLRGSSPSIRRHNSPPCYPECCCSSRCQARSGRIECCGSKAEQVSTAGRQVCSCMRNGDMG